MDGPNPSEMDIKVLTPAPTFCLQLEKYLSKMGIDYIYPLVKKIKKSKMQGFKYENKKMV